MSAFEDELVRVAAAVEAELDARLGEIPAEGEIARPGRLLAAMRHGVSSVRDGQRFTLGLIFHDAA